MKISRAVTKQHKVTQTREIDYLWINYPNYFLAKCKCFQCAGGLGELCGMAFTRLGSEYLCNFCVDGLEEKYPAQFYSMMFLLGVIKMQNVTRVVINEKVFKAYTDDQFKDDKNRLHFRNFYLKDGEERFGRAGVSFVIDDGPGPVLEAVRAILATVTLEFGRQFTIVENAKDSPEREK